MVQCLAPDCNHQSESRTWKFFGKEKKNEEYRRGIRLLRFVYFFAHKYCNNIKLKSSVCTRKGSANQFTTNRVQVSSFDVDRRIVLVWKYPWIKPSPTLDKFNFSEPNNHQMSSVEESKKVDHSRPDFV